MGSHYIGAIAIELLAIEARVVIASVETFLKYAEAIGLTVDVHSPHPHDECAF
ncbi:MAG: hypothetical protein H6Q71_1579 [Firmicutes bacterium]|nr:hypothetical protein [Bacillota bacterium]